MSERTGQPWKGETSKAEPRRRREGFYERYIVGRKVLDIGCADDPITPDCDKWDYSLGSGDATYMDGVPDESYETVYASHILEHVEQPIVALENWWRILKPGGHLIVCVPHRDLYEKSLHLPSHWNGDHKTMWLPFLGDKDDTRSLLVTADMAFGAHRVISIRTLDDGYDANGDGHPQGEYAIELIARKP